MKCAIALFALLGALPALAAAPFCVVSGSGRQSCHYYDANSCQQQARAMNGVCAANPERLQQRSGVDYSQGRSPMETGQYIQDQVDAGRRRKLEQEEHDARMAAYAAASAAPPPAPSCPAPPPAAIYRCPSAEGPATYSATPAVGCVVVAVAPAK